MMQADEFETRLRKDLPRGHAAQAKSTGRERGLFARWLSAAEMSGEQWRHEGGLLLGRRGGRLIGWKDDRHVMTIAGSRAGKGVSLIIPNLLLYEGSALVIDPKGENARITARRRGKGANGLGQDVYVLDPFGVSGGSCSSFNPLAELDTDSADLIEDAGMFADALITHPDKGERHWTESAQALLRALILTAAGDENPARRNLVTVRKLLMLTDEKIRDRQFEHPPSLGKLEAQEALIQILMAEDVKPYGYICVGVAEQLKAMGDNERGSVLSAARTQTQWLDSDKIDPVLTKSDFTLADLKRKRTTIYLCLPAARMATHARWLRLMISLALSVMERTPGKPKQPVLFVLDEFPALGHMQAIETAAGLMAGFGVKLWTIIQNVGQLKQHYDKAWETFFANCGVVTAFGVSDSETLKVLSEMLGRTSIVEQVSSGAVGQALVNGAAAFRDDRHDVPLLAEHELRLAFAKDKERVLIFNVEDVPAVAERLLYFKEPMFKGFYDEVAADG
ncbi:MAG: type IV secretory system conjugative DNA transfer family protein [Rhodomicrobium sp.]